MNHISKCLIMAGGKGTRLWPLSRKSKPKQFQTLTSNKTMLQETFLRLRKKYNLNDIYISTNTEYIPEIEHEILELSKNSILAEPEARGTASSIAMATAIIARESGEDTLLAIFPADHHIKNETVLIESIEKAEAFLKENPDFIVTFGIIPTYPETGYGYIKKGGTCISDKDKDIALVDRFVEKPDAVTAEKYLAEKDYLWNSGMYVFRVGAMMNKIGKYIPDTYKRALRISQSSEADITNVIAEEYPKMDKINLEYSVIENDPLVAVLPIEMGWSDVGSWSSLKDVLIDDPKGHFSKGDHTDFDSENLLVYGSKKHIVTVGIKDLIVIDTDDAILICNRKDAGKISEVVKKLEELNHKFL